VKYLGVTLSSSKSNEHVDSRIEASRRAFYALQGAGFTNTNANSGVISYVWNSAIRPVLTYGINCMHVSKKYLCNMEKAQARLLKAGLGLHKFCKNTHLLKALNVMKIESTMEISSLDLIRSVFHNSSRARSFYMYLLNMHSCGHLKNHSDLVSRAHKICNKYDVSFIRYVFDKSYSSHVRTNMKKRYDAPDGITDSVRQLLLRNDPYNRYVLNLLLMPSF
jgi:hypothetical protein